MTDFEKRTLAHKPYRPAAPPRRPDRPAPRSDEPIELTHRPGCPAGQGRLPDGDHRKSLGIEAYVVTGTGRYDRATGEYAPAPRMGVVRCLECAAQSTVPPESVPGVQARIAAHAQEVTDV